MNVKRIGVPVNDARQDLFSISFFVIVRLLHGTFIAITVGRICSYLKEGKIRRNKLSKALALIRCSFVNVVSTSNHNVHFDHNRTKYRKRFIQITKPARV